MIEKVDLPAEWKLKPQKDGSYKKELVHPWEIRATGKDVMELRDVFKDSAVDMMHEGFNEWKGIGETKITRPDGSTDVVRADKEHLYRRQPGFCVKATRPIFVMQGFGGMKREGLIKMRIRYVNGVREIVEAR